MMKKIAIVKQNIVIQYVYIAKSEDIQLIKIDQGELAVECPNNTDVGYIYHENVFLSHDEAIAQGLIEEPPQTVPDAITMRQARLILLTTGITALEVESVIASLSSPQREYAEIEWEYASEVFRDNSFIELLGSALNLSTEQIDQMFIDGAKL